MLLDIFHFGIMFSIPPQNRSKTVGVWGVCVLLIFFFFPFSSFKSFLFTSFFTGKDREDEGRNFSTVKHFSGKTWKKQDPTTSNQAR